jgi:subtilisin-like proprotein convertase family protein
MKLLKNPLLLMFLMVLSPRLLPAQTTESYTFTTNRLVPDGNLSGLIDGEYVSSAIGAISSVQVRLKVTGEFNGDLYAYLRNTNGFVVLLNRGGATTSNPSGYGDSGFNVTFQAAAANGDIHVYQNVTNPAAGSPLAGFWQPDGRTNDPATVTDLSPRTTSLTNFNGFNAAGTWTLYLADLQSGGTNMLTQWGLDISGAASPTLTWTNPAGITYGTALSLTQLNATATYGSTNVPGTFTYSSPAGTVLDVATNQTLSVMFTPHDTNSFLPVTANVTINVSPAPLIITANNTNNVYGAALPAFTASYSGFVNGDTAASLSTPVTLGTSAAASSPVGTYPVTASGAADANYAISYLNGTLTVNPAALSITANSTNKVYGAALPAFTASYSGFVNGDTAASLSTPVTLGTSAAASSPVGAYPITASGAAATNYTINYVNGMLSVSAATLTITAANETKAYGQALPELAATYAGFVNGDTTKSLTSVAILTTTANAGSGVGVYPITATDAVSSNYLFTYIAGSLSITNSLTSGALVSSANPSPTGSNVTFTATVAAVAPGAGTPTGTINFRIDGAVLAASVLSAGVATLTANNLTHGYHTVVAEYAGDSNFTGTTNSLTPNQLINTPPVAGNVTLYRNPVLGVKVQLATLLTNASSPDGDTLALSVSSTSASNATITVSGHWAFYTPPAGFTNADSFTYKVTDTYGGSATGTVTVAILVDNSQSQNLVITNPGSGGVLISGNGVPGYQYRLQYSVVPGPAYFWQTLTNVTADGTGKFEYTDTSGDLTRFYRTAYP